MGPASNGELNNKIYPACTWCKQCRSEQMHGLSCTPNIYTHLLPPLQFCPWAHVVRFLAQLLALDEEPGRECGRLPFLGKWHARMPLCMNRAKIIRKRAPPANSLCTRRRLDRPRFEITHRVNTTIRMVVGTCRLVWFALPAQLPAPSGRLRLQECNACRQV